VNRLPQGPVVGEITTLATLRRWGSFRKFESRAERLYGTRGLDAILGIGIGFQPTPVWGFPAYTYKGLLVPRLSGGAPGFTDIADLRAKALGGRGQLMRMEKTGQAGGAGSAGEAIRCLFSKPGLPAAGATAGATGAGTVFNSASTGALPLKDAWAGEQLYFVGAKAWHTHNVGAIMLYDYLFGVNRDVSLGAQTLTVTGVPTRYTGTAAVNTWLGTKITTTTTTAITMSVDYTDETGAARSSVTVSIQAAGVHDPLLAPGNGQAGRGFLWPTTTLGIREIDGITNNTSTATGNADFMLGHNIACIPLAQSWTGPGCVPGYTDGHLSAFNFCPIQNGACLSVLEYCDYASNTGTMQLEDILIVSGT
jgi:hypothetical protein